MKIHTSELDSILETVQMYHDGHLYQDAEKLKRHFIPRAGLSDILKGKLFLMNLVPLRRSGSVSLSYRASPRRTSSTALLRWLTI